MDVHNKLFYSLNSELRNRLALIKKKATDYLKRIIIIFPEYTDHGIKHSDSILFILESWLLDNEQKQILLSNPYDIFFLYASAYLHDIGMIEYPELILPDYVKDTEEIKKYIREIHNERSYILIQKIWNDLDIEDEFQAEIIALICLGHRKVQLTDSRIKDKIPYRSGFLVNVQFLAACIRLADELDLTFERTSLKIFDLVQNKSSLTISEWNKHFSVGGVAPHPYYPSTIHVRCRCKDAEIHRALKRHEIKIQNMLYDINRHIEPRFLYSSILYDIVSIKYEPIDIKFKVDASSVIHLFMGNKLYEDKRVFLREIIQNSIDACNIRKCFDSTYSPFINIKIEQNTMNNEVEVIMTDNGIGMDKEWIDKYFLSVGISFYKSDELEQLKIKRDLYCTFISQFGIGFLSCFNLAKRVIIKTSKPPSMGLNITIFDLNAYFDVRTFEQQDQGTEVRIILPKTNWLLEEDCLCYLKTNIRYTEIPIYFRDKRGETITIGQEIMDYSKERPCTTKLLSIRLPLYRSEGYIAMSFLPDISNASELGKTIGGISIFQDGIFVVQSVELLPPEAIGFIIGRINLLGKDRLPLSINRNRVIWGEHELRYFRNIVQMGIIDIFNSMAIINKNNESNIYTLSETIIRFINVNVLSDDTYNNMNIILRKLVSDKFVNKINSELLEYLKEELDNKYLRNKDAFYRFVLGKKLWLDYLEPHIMESIWQINLIWEIMAKKRRSRRAGKRSASRL